MSYTLYKKWHFPFADRDRHGKMDQEALVEATNEQIPHPIVMWWTPFTREPGRVKQCGQVNCYFTVDRHYKDHQNTTVPYGHTFNLAHGHLQPCPWSHPQPHPWSQPHPMTTECWPSSACRNSMTPISTSTVMWMRT